MEFRERRNRCWWGENQRRSLDLSDGDLRNASGRQLYRRRLRSREHTEGSWKVELQSNEVPQKDGMRKNKIRVSVLVWQLIPVIPVFSD